METPDIAGWNLATRFGTEVAALTALGTAGWQLGPGTLRWVLAIGVPLAAAVTWTTFNVPDDPSRSGRAPIEVDGRIRLAVELAVLGSGAVAIWWAGHPALAVGYATAVVVQYATALDRVNWLLGR